MRFVAAVFCGLVCLGALGCGASYPYYTAEGTKETRVVTVHVDANTKLEVLVGTGPGGMSGADKRLLQEGKQAVVKNRGVEVTLSGKLTETKIEKVVYEGKDVTDGSR